MNLITLYSTCFGFGVTFLMIQLFFAFGEDADDAEDSLDDNYSDPEANIENNLSSDQIDSDNDINTDKIQTGYNKNNLSIILKCLLYFLKLSRKTTYFCAGFGSMGVICSLAKVNTALTFMSSMIVGIISLLLTDLAFKFINLTNKNKDARIKTRDLTGCYAEVLSKTGYGKHNIGEIKISLDNQIINLYAMAKEENCEFNKGETVIIYKIDRNGYAVIEQDTKNNIAKNTGENYANERREM